MGEPGMGLQLKLMCARYQSVPKIAKVKRNRKRRREGSVQEIAKAEMSEIKQDWISELPDGILCIISLLPMREAVRTSILSSRWRYYWKSISNLTFDAATMFGNSCPWKGLWWNLTEVEKNSRIREFVRLIDEFLWLHHVSKVETFKVHFNFCSKYHNRLDRWISIAINAGVEKLDLCLCEDTCTVQDQHYDFPHQLLGCGKASLKYLHLESCILRPRPDFKGFNFLTTLTLKSVVLYDGDFVNLVSSCPLLERLKVIYCTRLVNLKIPGPSPRLNYLMVKLHPGCALEEISIYAINLITFECLGLTVNFSSMNVPRLLHVSINFGGEYPTTIIDLSDHLPQLESLHLCYRHGPEALVIQESLPMYTNLKQLTMVISLGRTDDLLWIASLLKSCPVLQKLHVDLPIYDDYEEPKEIRRPLRCPHNHLKEVLVSGFTGVQNQMELTICLLNNAVELELMTIDPRLMLHDGDGQWEVEDANDNSDDYYKTWRRTRRQIARRHLCREAFPGTKLVIL